MLKFFSTSIFLLLSISSFCQAPGTIDLDFKTGRFANDKIWDIDKYPGGGYLVTGNFISYDDFYIPHMAVLNSDLSIDTTFIPTWNLSGADVKFAERVTGGKILVAGNFTHNGSTNYHSLLRLNADGTVDETFPDVFADAETGVNIHAMEIADDYIMLAGKFKFPGEDSKRCIIRIDYDGNIDTTFKTHFGLLADEPDIYQLEITSDDKYVISGVFAGYEDDYSIRKLMKLNTDGTRDASFFVSEVTPADRYVYYMGIQPDDNILVGGSFNEINGSDEHGIAKLDTDGTKSSSFYPGSLYAIGSYSASKLCHSYTTETGDIIIAGGFDKYSYLTPNSMTKMGPGGSIYGMFREASSDPHDGAQYSAELNYARPISHIQDFLVLNSGDITVAGSFNVFDEAQCNNICLLDSNGLVKPEMPEQIGFNDDVKKIIVQPDGKILVLGKFTQYGYNEQDHLIRLNANGEFDSSFTFSTDDKLYDMELLGDGKILVAGDFFYVNGVSRRTIARLNSDGSTDVSFNPGGGATGGSKSIYDIAVLPDGKILIGGSFTVYNAVTRKNVARLNSNGSLDTSFDPLGGFDYAVHEIIILPDTTYLIGGEFTKYQGITMKGIIKLYDDASRDASFTSIVSDGMVNAIELTEDDKILIGGTFITTGTGNDKLTKLNFDGTADATFSALFTSDASVNTIKNIKAGYYAVGGKFKSYNAENFESFIMIDANGMVHPDISFAEKTDSSILSIALDADSNLLVGGAFVSLNGLSRNRIAKLSGITEAPPVCNIPTGVTATGITPSSAKVKWNLMADAETYRVQYRILGTTSWTSKTSITNQKKLKLLSPSTTYEYRVRSQCADGVLSAYSEIETFTTLPMKLQNENDTMHVSIFPNPNNGTFIIKTENLSGVTNIELFDTTGKIIFSTLTNFQVASTYEITLQNNYAGLVIVKLTSPSAISHQTLVIQ